jgi:cysteine desulfurase/selenocysteine lyase
MPDPPTDLASPGYSGGLLAEKPMNNWLAESYRKEFPVTAKYVYLDHAGVAPLSRRVRNAVENFLNDATGGGAFHYPAWAQRIDGSRRACAELVNAAPEEIAFVKSTSHGLSIVANGLDWQEGDNLLIYEKEFPSNIYPWLNLQKKGVRVKIIPSREGRILLEDIEQLIDSRTRLLAISSVQFSNGFRIDLQNVGELCRQRNVLLCVDAIQSLGILPIDVKKYHIDFLSADAHKWLLGPEGVGIFYCRQEHCERLSPPLLGWKSVQNEFDFDHPQLLLKTNALKFEEGSQNLMGILGLNAALGLLAEVGLEVIKQRVLDLGDFVIREAEKKGFAVLTPKVRKERGGNITISGPFNPVAVRDALRDKRIMVNARGGGVRISPHFYNTEEELLHLFSAIDGIIQVRDRY